MSRKKVSIIGAGNVGSSLAAYLDQKNICDIVLLDIVEGVPIGKGLDLLQAGPILNYSISVKGSNDYKDISGSEIVVVTAGLPRKQGWPERVWFTKKPKF